MSKTYFSAQGTVVAVDNVSFDLGEGGFTTIVGPSGCGKSTVLNILAGLVAQTSGVAALRSQPILGPSRSIGYVTQRDNLLPWRTVLGNVEIGLEIAGVPREERIARARAHLARVGLQGFERHFPHELSGGMRQRVNIARTLIRDPSVVIMDEPFGPLDALTRGHLQTQLLDIWAETGKTILFITHDLVEAIALSDHVLVMSARPGRVKASIPISIPRPRKVFEVHKEPGFRRAHEEIWDELVTELDKTSIQLEKDVAVHKTPLGHTAAKGIV